LGDTALTDQGDFVHRDTIPFAFTTHPAQWLSVHSCLRRGLRVRREAESILPLSARLPSTRSSWVGPESVSGRAYGLPLRVGARAGAAGRRAPRRWHACTLPRDTRRPDSYKMPLSPLRSRRTLCSHRSSLGPGFPLPSAG